MAKNVIFREIWFDGTKQDSKEIDRQLKNIHGILKVKDMFERE